MARLPINCCWRPIDGGEKPDLLASQLLEFIAIDDMFRAVLDG
jgi:hypothetical protein